MTLNEYKLNNVATPVVGESYKVKGIIVREMEDKFNPGKMRNVVILMTDKGNVYATTGLANAVLATIDSDGFEEAERQIKDVSLLCNTYMSKRANREVKTMAFVD